MNHDYEHCIDFKDDCPESCHRAQLVRDLEENYPEMEVSWMNFSDCPDCERNRLAKNSPKAAKNIDDQISRSAIVSALKERAETLKGTYGDLGGACSGAAKLAESMPPATYTKIKPLPDYARKIAPLPEEKDVPDTNVGDMISRFSLLAKYDKEHEGPPGRARQLIVEEPPAHTEIIYCKDCRKHNKKVGFDENFQPVWKEDACPLVSWRGKAQGHEFDYQFCAFADKRKEKHDEI